jgi:outer membrane protein assembly factor BamD
MKLKIKHILAVLFFAGVFSSCEYQKLLKSTDNKLKYEKAMAYYDDEDYIHALTLFEQLIPIYRGTEKGEEISYRYAYCKYYTKQYIEAGHYFRSYINSFPNSNFTEECTYMSAYCYYLESPKPSLDQSSTYKALSELQLFMERFPESEHLMDCQTLIDELMKKLQKKSYDNALLYYRIGQYKAASIALKSSLEKFPDTEYREEIMYRIVKSEYLLAVNSIYGKTLERLKAAHKDFNDFQREFPESKYMKELTKINKDIEEKISFLES